MTEIPGTPTDYDLIDAFHCAEMSYLASLYAPTLSVLGSNRLNELMKVRDDAWKALEDRFHELRASKSPKKKRDAAERETVA